MWHTGSFHGGRAAWFRRFWVLIIACTAVHGFQLQAQNQFGIPRPDHVIIVVEENRGYVGTIGSPTAPYINELARRGASFTQSYAEGIPASRTTSRCFPAPRKA